MIKSSTNVFRNKKKTVYLIMVIAMAIVTLPLMVSAKESNVKCEMLKKGSYYKDRDELAKKMKDMNLHIYQIHNSATDIETLAFIPQGLTMTTGWYPLKEGADLSKVIKSVDINTGFGARLYKVEFDQVIFLYTSVKNVRLNTKFAKTEGNKIVNLSHRDFKTLEIEPRRRIRKKR
ncbi:hypothetical protein ACFL03_11580 [Thermodesulfobacteriota bacterium]